MTGSTGADLANSRNALLPHRPVSLCGNWNRPGTGLRTSRSSASRSSAAAGSGRPLPRARRGRRRGRAVPTGATARSRRRRIVPTRCCCACPTPRSPRWPRRSPPVPPVGHCSGATGLDALAPTRRSRCIPLMTVTADAGPEVLAGAGAAIAGSTPRALALARRARRAAGHARRSRSPTPTAPPTTPRPRSPPTSWSRSRPPPSAWPPTAGLPRELLVPLVRATVENWARARPRAGADRSRGPRRRGDRAPPASRASPTARRSCWACSTRSSTPPSAGRERPRRGGGGMIVVESIARAARRALAPGRRAGRRLGLVPTMGAFHDGHLSLMRHAVRECDVVVVSLFVNPPQFNDAADLAAYPRDQQRRRRAGRRRSASTGCSRRRSPRCIPPASPRPSSVSGVTEPLEGAHRGPATSTASPRSSPSC